MRRHVAPAALLLALSFSAWAAEPAAPVPTLTAAARVGTAPPGMAARPNAAATQAQDEAAEPPTSRPWLLVLSVVVLAGVMARRRM